MATTDKLAGLSQAQLDSHWMAFTVIENLNKIQELLFRRRVNTIKPRTGVPLPVPVAYHSFGGWKRSLFGDLHAYGPDGVRFYTKRKTVTQRWPSSGVREGASFAFPS